MKLAYRKPENIEYTYISISCFFDNALFLIQLTDYSHLWNASQKYN